MAEYGLHFFRIFHLIENFTSASFKDQTCLPQQFVSSKWKLQVVDEFRKTCELFLCSKNKRGRVGVQIACIPFFVGGLPGIYFYDGRPKLFPIIC